MPAGPTPGYAARRNGSSLPAPVAATSSIPGATVLPPALRLDHHPPFVEADVPDVEVDQGGETDPGAEE